MQQHITVDLVIVGAGIVGTTLFLHLQSLPLCIAFIEAKDPALPIDPTIPDSPISLVPINIALLKKVGVWQACIPYAQPIHHIQVSEQGYFGQLRFNSWNVQQDALGYVIPRLHLLSKLHQQFLKIRKEKKIKHYYPNTQLIALNQEKNSGWKLTLNHQNSLLIIDALLVIGADGSHSKVRELCQIKTIYDDRPKVAVSTWATLSTAHQGRAFQRFTSEGVLALLPTHLPNTVGVVWMPRTLKKIFNVNDAGIALQWMAILQSKLPLTLGKICTIDTVQSHQIHCFHTHLPQQKNIILFGNAAYQLYPIAAQGLNLALQEVATFKQYLETKVQTKHHVPFKDLELNMYYKAQIPDREKLRQVIYHLFQWSQFHTASFRWIRSIGLTLLDIAPFKKNIICYFMGIKG